VSAAACPGCQQAACLCLGTVPQVMYPYLQQPSFFCRALDFFVKGRFCKTEYPVIFFYTIKPGYIFHDAVIQEVWNGYATFRFWCLWFKEKFLSLYLCIVFTYVKFFTGQDISRGKGKQFTTTYASIEQYIKGKFKIWFLYSF